MPLESRPPFQNSAKLIPLLPFYTPKDGKTLFFREKNIIRSLRSSNWQKLTGRGK
jgi:hypothetical protein